MEIVPPRIRTVLLSFGPPLHHARFQAITGGGRKSSTSLNGCTNQTVKKIAAEGWQLGSPITIGGDIIHPNPTYRELYHDQVMWPEVRAFLEGAGMHLFDEWPDNSGYFGDAVFVRG